MSLIVSIDVGTANIGLCIFDPVDPSRSVFRTVGMVDRDDMVTSVIAFFESDVGIFMTNVKFVVIEHQCGSKMIVVQNLMRMYCRMKNIPVLYARPQNVKHFMKIPATTGVHKINKTLMMHAINKVIRECFPTLLDKFSNAAIAIKNKVDDYCDATAQALYAYDILKDIDSDELHGYMYICDVDGVQPPNATESLFLEATTKRKHDVFDDPRELLPSADDVGCVRSINKMRRTRHGLRMSEVSGGKSNADLQMTTEELLNLPMRRTFSNQCKNRRVNNTLEEMMMRYSLTKIDRCAAMLEAGCSEAVIRLMINKEINDRVKRHSFKMSARYIDPRHPLTAQLFNDFVIQKLRVRRDQAVLLARHRLALYKVLQNETTTTASNIMKLRTEMFHHEMDINARVSKIIGNEYLSEFLIDGSNLDVLKVYIERLMSIFIEKSKVENDKFNELKKLFDRSVDIIRKKHDKIAKLSHEVGLNLVVLERQIHHDVQIPVNIEEELPDYLMSDYASRLSDIEKESVKEDAAIYITPEYRWPLGDHKSELNELIKEPRILSCPYTGVLFARHHAKDIGLERSFSCSPLQIPLISTGDINIGVNKSRIHPRTYKHNDTPKMPVLSGYISRMYDVRVPGELDYFYHNKDNVLSTHEEVFSAVTGEKFTDPMVDICQDKPSGHIDIRYKSREEIRFA